MSAPAAQPTAVRRLDTPGAAELAGLAAVFEDLQYALRCCEHLVSEPVRRGADPVLVEALWTGALLAYVRCFSPRAPCSPPPTWTRSRAGRTASTGSCTRCC
ncbi:hypothetical protein BJF90_07615 [Pseudonocardia sp. CNS-004]|nr:hypothetical protein BJF90_07615 [Pseudonocardia sp. CNS-004]